jgi:hypothetical protein
VRLGGIPIEPDVAAGLGEEIARAIPRSWFAER